MKLHLGCGQKYLEGYINIDYPMTEHSVQQKSVADELANLMELRYKPGSIDEVRLHHVFEHFSRSTASALLASWNSWLKEGGVLRIEVPDFEKTGKVALSRFSSKKGKSVAIRHIFGSQEAHWAVHYHGYTPSGLAAYIESYGFKVQKKDKNSHLGTYNVDITAIKQSSKSKAESLAITKDYLSTFMVADVESERFMLETWFKEYDLQVEKTFAK
jgi:predicted SAM-dependent methyltransferase